jgi:hypothetical protein
MSYHKRTCVTDLVRICLNTGFKAPGSGPLVSKGCATIQTSGQKMISKRQDVKINSTGNSYDAKGNLRNYSDASEIFPSARISASTSTSKCTHPSMHSITMIAVCGLIDVTHQHHARFSKRRLTQHLWMVKKSMFCTTAPVRSRCNIRMLSIYMPAVSGIRI